MAERNEKLNALLTAYGQKGAVKMKEMKLVSILSLIGKNIDGIKADIRTRETDGTLRYSDPNTFPEEQNPIIVTMKSVRIEKHKISTKDKEKSDWLYWRWEGYSCGYSGDANKKNWSTYHILIESI